MSVAKDIEALFSQLVDNPGFLVQAMERGGDVLSGSRAANFFVDGLCDTESDWDFYCRCCDPEDTQTKCYLYTYFEGSGCTWEKVKSAYGDQEVFSVYTGVLRGAKVQLIVYRLENTIDGILGFHSTVPQCIVAHDAAFCAYYDLLEKKRGVRWATKFTSVLNIDNAINSRNEKAVAKYTKRGIQFIPYREYTETLGCSVPNPRLRKSSDSSSKLLKDTKRCSLSDISWLECPEGCIMLES